MGVRLVNLGEGQSLVAIARNAEAIDNTLIADAEGDGEVDDNGEATAAGVVDPADVVDFAEAEDLADITETETEAGDPEDDGDAE
jgi:hypothetical protein